MSDRERLRVAEEASFEPGERHIIETDGGSIGVFNVDGEYYAVANRCAHQGGPVCTGKQQGALEAEFTGPGERVREAFSDDVPAIACPWHGWEYDLRTGAHIGDDDYAIPTFGTVVEDGVVFVEI